MEKNALIELRMYAEKLADLVKKIQENKDFEVSAETYIEREMCVAFLRKFENLRIEYGGSNGNKILVKNFNEKFNFFIY